MCISYFCLVALKTAFSFIFIEMIHTFSFTKDSSFMIHSEIRRFWRPIDGWQCVKIKTKSKCHDMEEGQWEVLRFSILND